MPHCHATSCGPKHVAELELLTSDDNGQVTRRQDRTSRPAPSCMPVQLTPFERPGEQHRKACTVSNASQHQRDL